MNARILLLAVLSITWTSCSGNATPDVGPTATKVGPEAPEATLAESTTTTEAELGAKAVDTLRILTYNILVGGNRVDPEVLIDVLLVYDPDIIGLQEANDWDQDGFARIEQLATALGMEYAYCNAFENDEGPSFDTIVLSRFEILSTATYPEVLHCMGVVEVRLPDGRTLQVVNVHLRPGYCRVLLEEALAIVPFAEDSAVMMGDFNFVDQGYIDTGQNAPPQASVCNERMREAGWTYLSGEMPVGEIDHIWVSKSLADLEYFQWSTPNYLVEQKLLSEISDHRPVAADLYMLLGEQGVLAE